MRPSLIVAVAVSLASCSDRPSAVEQSELLSRIRAEQSDRAAQMGRWRSAVDAAPSLDGGEPCDFPGGKVEQSFRSGNDPLYSYVIGGDRLGVLADQVPAVLDREGFVAIQNEVLSRKKAQGFELSFVPDVREEAQFEWKHGTLFETKRPARLAGKMALYDHGAEKVICAGHVEVSGPEVGRELLGRQRYTNKEWAALPWSKKKDTAQVANPEVILQLYEKGFAAARTSLWKVP